MATRNQIIEGAFQLIGEYSAGETLSGPDVAIGSDFLNDIVRELAADGLHLWQRSLVSFTPVASQTSYTIGSGGNIDTTRPLTIHQAFVRETASSTDTELVQVSRDEYMRLSGKSSTGRPNQFYYQPTIPLGTLFLYVTPDSATASNTTIFLDTHIPMDTFTSASATQDFPDEWTRLLKYALAMDMSVVYSVPDNQYQKIVMGYNAAYDKILAHDSENASVFIRPDAMFRWYKGR